MARKLLSSLSNAGMIGAVLAAQLIVFGLPFGWTQLAGVDVIAALLWLLAMFAVSLAVFGASNKLLKRLG